MYNNCSFSIYEMPGEMINGIQQPSGSNSINNVKNTSHGIYEDKNGIYEDKDNKMKVIKTKLKILVPLIVVIVICCIFTILINNTRDTKIMQDTLKYLKATTAMKANILDLDQIIMIFRSVIILCICILALFNFVFFCQI